MFPLLFLIFVITPIIEIVLFIQVGGLIGVPATIAIVIITAVLGTTLLRMQGLSVMRRALEATDRGELPLEPVIDGLGLLLAGALLLTPGFLTDTIGFLLLVPSVRRALARWVFMRMMRSGRVSMTMHGRAEHWHSAGARPSDAPPSQPEVIDVEYESVEEGEEARRSGEEAKPGRGGRPRSPWER